MKRIKNIIIGVLVISALFIFIGQLSTKKLHAAAKVEKSSIEVTNVQVNKHSVKLNIKISCAENETLQYGEKIYIEKYIGGKWQKLEQKKGMSFSTSVYTINSGSVNKKVNLTFAYNKKDLTYGRYRIYISSNIKGVNKFAYFKIPDYKEILISDDKKIYVKTHSVLKLNISSGKILKSSSGNKEVAVVNNKGIITTKRQGKTIININLKKKNIKIKLYVKRKIKKANASTIKLKFPKTISINDCDDVNYTIKNMSDEDVSIMTTPFTVEKYVNKKWEIISPYSMNNYNYLLRLNAHESSVGKINLIKIYPNITEGKYKIIMNGARTQIISKFDITK